MVHSSEKRVLAMQYRRRGFSYTEIAGLVEVSKSTVSAWLAKDPYSKRVRVENTERAARENRKRLSLLNKARSKERKRRYDEALKTALTEYRHYRRDPLFVAGLMLYVSEGDTTGRHVVRFSTTKLSSHQIFHRFCRQFLGVAADQVKFWLLLYPTLSESTCAHEWNRQLKLRPGQWYKNQIIQGKSAKKPLHFGVGNTIIGDTVLKQKLMCWIELATKELKK